MLSHLDAFDPLTGERVWRHDTKHPLLAALLSTAGGLVFTGDPEGNFFALDGRSGEKLWSFPTGSGHRGGPISYAVDGRQYIATPSGWGSSLGVGAATARARRRKVDWALEVAGLLEGRYADCEKITLVCDNLNTHTKGAFYEVFDPTRARQLVRRIEFCHTPKHGSWLNIAELEGARQGSTVFAFTLPDD